MSVPLGAPIFMLPLAGIVFLVGALVQQTAGSYAATYPQSVLVYLATTVAGLAVQAVAFVILISA